MSPYPDYSRGGPAHRRHAARVFAGVGMHPLALAVAVPLAAYAGALLWRAHQPGLALAAVLAALAGGLTLEYQTAPLPRVLGYLLGLTSVGASVTATDLAALAYGPWTILGAVAFPSWAASLGLWTAGVASYAGARALWGRPLVAVDVLTVAGAAGLVHAVAVLLVREAQEHAELSLTDPLTGLANRRTLQWRLEQELAQAGRTGEPLALLYLDLNEFKHVNDAFGHHVGDRALTQVADALQHTVRTHDLVARVGGDEFVILAPGLPEDHAAHLASRLQTAVTRAPLPLPLRVSMGWVIAPRDGTTPAALLDLADAGLFEHKRASRRPGRSLVDELRAALEVLPDGAQQLVHLLDTEKVELEVEEHLAQVGRWSLQLAKTVGLDAERQRCLAQAALLHDVGKLGVPRSLLRRPGPLSPEERALLVQHVAKGVTLLRTLDVDERVVAIVAGHHERWDGTGYPAGLAGEAIPLEARILAVVDSYDAMTTQRVYQNARPPEDAVRELQREAGRQFDPRLVELFIAITPWRADPPPAAALPAAR